MFNLIAYRGNPYYNAKVRLCVRFKPYLRYKQTSAGIAPCAANIFLVHHFFQTHFSP